MGRACKPSTFTSTIHPPQDRLRNPLATCLHRSEQDRRPSTIDPLLYIGHLTGGTRCNTTATRYASSKARKHEIHAVHLLRPTGLLSPWPTGQFCFPYQSRPETEGGMCTLTTEVYTVARRAVCYLLLTYCTVSAQLPITHLSPITFQLPLATNGCPTVASPDGAETWLRDVCTFRWQMEILLGMRFCCWHSKIACSFPPSSPRWHLPSRRCLLPCPHTILVPGASSEPASCGFWPWTALDKFQRTSSVTCTWSGVFRRFLRAPRCWSFQGGEIIHHLFHV